MSSYQFFSGGKDRDYREWYKVEICSSHGCNAAGFQPSSKIGESAAIAGLGVFGGVVFASPGISMAAPLCHLPAPGKLTFTTYQWSTKSLLTILHHCLDL